MGENSRKKNSQKIISKIVTFSQNSRVYIQWIPSHVGIFGNEMVDLLLKEVSALPSATSNELFVSEIFSNLRVKANSTWRVPPTHDWNDGNRPGLSL
ncbi:RNase H domain-containing protein [Nephila pilipes]|uniref:RNase H domain-containing protein n=1 Tax=Nephila pilipes TaxID=299642 RepID=A0A8X6TNC1_NEPPI|nr:RNase H domain-containing protein [Nephila pilipes]